MEIINKKDIKFNKKNYNHSINRLGIMLDRSELLISILYKCFINGITYVPFDVNWPCDKICNIVSEENLNMIITSSKYSNIFKDVELLIVDNKNDVADFYLSNHDNNIAYILHTSGSTGKPKGVEITREALFNFIDGVSEIIDFSDGKRIACFTTVSFDIFFLESIMALYKGLTVVLANEEEQRNPRLMVKLIEENNVDMIQMTPSRMQLLLNHDKELSCLKNVKEIMIGGEPFPLFLLKTLQVKTSAKIFNMYGPTETTIWSCISDLTEKSTIDIGKPIKETQVYILDENHNIVPNGNIGEIAIAGKSLAKGYVNNEKLTNEKFINLPEKPETCIYLTGDLGRYLSDGNLECLGRIDNQVKIRGYRVELEEIENLMMQHPNIKKAVASIVENEDNKSLIAFYLSDIDIEENTIKEFLNQKLPEYMVPIIYYHLDELPYTNNDKVDRKQLINNYYNHNIKYDKIKTQKNQSESLTNLELRVLKIICENQDEKFNNNVTINSSLSDLSIDSITFIKIIIALETEFEFEFDDEILLFTSFPTIKSMIVYIESKIT
ncbi:MAG: hypothetical protein A2Y40_06660 [Candidatus Margulisbacteria bacterium GWF2_35_9]|nr:MAG: hypothetical protein A2Y40_06660 [Candidatus Margulisbacteria bacterium GWF2_35_9]